jgi:serine/threonine protein kinase
MLSMASNPGDEISGLRGCYRLESRHGAGSFGVTYRARDASQGMSVLVKELRVEKLDDWKALELFEREAEVLASLSHPNIPAFRDFFAHGGPSPLPAIAMSSYTGPEHLSLMLVQEFIEGTTLQQRINQEQRLPPESAEGVLRALLGALQYLHQRNPPLVHRDIKPGNVILTSEAKPYLVDFGAIQNRLRNADAAGSTIVGTLGYMPLEQTRGDARPASDLYALGVTMVVALAGRPIQDIPVDEATGKIAIDRALHPETPRRLRDALDSMIAVGVSQRAQSASEVLARLDRAEPPVAPAKPPPQRSWKWASFMVGGLLLIGAGLGLSVPMMSHWSAQPPTAPTPRSPSVSTAPSACPENMAAIAGGTFIVGDRHDTVTVAKYCLDRTEVTVSAYGACVAAGHCSEPGPYNSTSVPSGVYCNWKHAGRDDHPVNCVDWFQAESYCQWQDRRLPSEEEWEWAARGGSAGRTFPWGEGTPDVQFCWSGVSQRSGTCRVGSFADGDAPGGIHDLAGNVWEWTASKLGTSRVARSDSWASKDPQHARAAYRFDHPATERSTLLGFRCAR